MNIVVVLDATLSHTHTALATEALKAIADAGGHGLHIGRRSSDGSVEALSDDAIAQADVLILTSAAQRAEPRFQGSKTFQTGIGPLILRTRLVIEEALGLPACASDTPVRAGAGATMDAEKVCLVAVTACPTGIAHTFMAAEALRRAAAKLGFEIAIETQGSVGAGTVLTDEQIDRADAVIVAADTHVDTARFARKRLYRISTKEALRSGARVIESALALPGVAPTVKADAVPASPSEVNSSAGAAYKHLMTGVSYMLPLVTAGGLLVALGFLAGGVDAAEHQGSLGWALIQVGGGAAFSLYVPVLAAFIAYSIAERPGLAPGLVGGSLAMTLGAGFLGGIVAGFLAGYVTRYLNGNIKLPGDFAGLKPVLVLPLLSTLVVGLVMTFFVGAPAKLLLDGLTTWLNGMQLSSALFLGLLLGAMMAVDMGGPVNKAAYTFSVALLASKVYGPIAVVMAAGMTPPLGIALATVLAPSRFSEEERNTGRAAAILGLSFITEGAIPYAARDPLRVIPCLVLGSATAGALAMVFGVHLMVPHGGVFALFIPHAVDGLGPYVIAILGGTAVTAATLLLAKRRST